jgi:hypothetical protein
MMAQTFIIPVIYEGEETDFEASFQPYGYTYRIAVDLFGTTVLFEPDEEGSYRAVMSPDEIIISNAINRELLQAIITVLQTVPEP